MGTSYYCYGTYFHSKAHTHTHLADCCNGCKICLTAFVLFLNDSRYLVYGLPVSRPFHFLHHQWMVFVLFSEKCVVWMVVMSFLSSFSKFDAHSQEYGTRSHTTVLNFYEFLKVTFHIQYNCASKASKQLFDSRTQIVVHNSTIILYTQHRLQALGDEIISTMLGRWLRYIFSGNNRIVPTTKTISFANGSDSVGNGFCVCRAP